MKKLLFIFSILATMNLQAWSCFGNTAPQEAKKEKMPLQHASKAALDVSTEELADAFTAVGDFVEAGLGPWTIAYSNSGNFVASPNFVDNTVSLFRVNCDNGTLAPIQTVVTGSFPVGFDYSPRDNYAAVVNSDSPDGFTAGPNGSITVYRVNCITGEWSLIQTIADPNLPFSIAYSPDGRFAAVTDYTDSANGVNSRTVIYRVSPISGMLLFVDEITNNRGQSVVAWAPDGKFIAVTNFDDNSVSIYSVDPTTGALVEIAGSPFFTLPGIGPVDLAYQHDGNFLAVADFTSGDVSVFEVNLVTGGLISTQTIDTTAANSNPTDIAFSQNDSLAALGSAINAGSVVVFCVTDGTWCTSPIQTLPPAEFPRGIDFAPCSDFAVGSVYGNEVNPGTVQVYQTNDEVCPDCSP